MSTLHKDLGHSFVLSLDKSDFHESMVSGVDLVLDQIVKGGVLKEGVLKDIPIFGTLYKIAKAGSNVRDILFARKLAKFLYQLGDIPQETRCRFVKSIRDKSDQCQKVGEGVILLLERSDDMEKPKIIGKLFSNFVLSRIDLETFFRLAQIVDRSHLPDLKLLATKHNNPFLNQWLTPIQIETLYNLGLLSVKLIDTTRVSLLNGLREKGASDMEYQVNDLALLLVQMAF